MKFLPLIIAGIIISQKLNAQEVTKNAEKIVADSTATKKGLMNICYIIYFCVCVCRLSSTTKR